MRDHERVRFAYTARDQAGTRREAEPHALVNAGRRWYLVAWDCNRNDWRTFRVDRISKVDSTGARFTERRLPGGDAASYVQRSLRSFSSRYEARVTIECSKQELGNRRWLGEAVDIGEGRCEVRTADDNLDWLAMRLAMIPYPYSVDGPPELIERMRAIAQGISLGISDSAHNSP